jgi:peptidyl-prolyl cis-trans isomerase A (cyclophilin A)
MTYRNIVLTILLSVCLGGSVVAQTSKQESQSKAKKGNPVVLMKTSMGTIKIELFQDQAPISVKNFLSYVDDKFYDNTVFHRVIKGFMVQCGGFAASDPIKQKKPKAPIKNESDNGLKNDRGTLAMARTMEPNSATSQFFINAVDNAFLNKGADVGYAVFGKVVEGMDVVDKIRAVKTGNQPAIALSGDNEVKTTFQDVPITKVIIESIRREGHK